MKTTSHAPVWTPAQMRDHANGLTVMQPHDPSGKFCPGAQKVCDNAASMLRQAADQAERWRALEQYLPQLACRCNADDVVNGIGQWAVEQVQAEMARLERAPSPVRREGSEVDE